jgi:lipopolysaccharide heptosyltransferase II
MKCTNLVKLFDRLIGRISVQLVCKWSSRQLQPEKTYRPVNSLLLIRPGGIGDAVLLIPTIKALRKTYPTCAIDILAERRNAPVFHLVSGIRMVYLYDTLAGLSSVLCNRYDAVIDTEQWYRLSAVVTRMVNAPMKIGYGTNERARLFTHPAIYSFDDYEVDSFLKLLHPLGIAVPQAVRPPFLDIPEPAAHTAASLLEGEGREPVVALFPGSSDRKKCWEMVRFISLATRLTEGGAAVVIVGGQEEVSAGEEIIKGATGLNLAGKTSLVETAAIIARADVLVSGDSGLLHIATGLHIPTVALFGPSNIEKWAPRGSGHKVIGKRLSCSPCSRYGTIPPCPHNVRCMADISVEEVVHAVETLLAEQGPRKNDKNP